MRVHLWEVLALVHTAAAGLASEARTPQPTATPLMSQRLHVWLWRWLLQYPSILPDPRPWDPGVHRLQPTRAEQLRGHYLVVQHADSASATWILLW
jgi:hypothetical protein